MLLLLIIDPINILMLILLIWLVLIINPIQTDFQIIKYHIFMKYKQN
jgi:hypothetical protein